MTKQIEVSFRWPVKQTGEREIEVQIPVGAGAPLISEQAAEQLKLSEKEYIAAEDATLRAIIIVQ